MFLWKIHDITGRKSTLAKKGLANFLQNVQNYILFLVFILKTQLHDLHYTQTMTIVSWCIIENGHSFEWNDDRVTVLLKQTDFKKFSYNQF